MSTPLSKALYGELKAREGLQFIKVDLLKKCTVLVDGKDKLTPANRVTVEKIRELLLQTVTHCEHYLGLSNDKT